ncbi:hypothetical protein GCK72_025402 [Caenorhabditis remanei]|uniref:Skp1-related protein n=2 Tax=Caenorhabditis remanei TaxID=31234 RepID=E3MJN0_CAERE|nr:hypothetical protein GCK72_025402 [Caenorhabditis remanei]EFP03660.1 CRE-SKR-19 protein [Caenorhabditis remanei]KAF1748935.1 hypothetical protein GCK72_025402 [Caenorhabditis remanei]
MQVEQPVALYKLRSSEPQIFLVDRRTVAMIGRLEELFTTVGLDRIPSDQLPPIVLELPATVLRKLIEWCDHHKFDAPFDESQPLPAELPDWDTNFFMIRHTLLFDLLRAARHFDVPGLFSMCCHVVQQNPLEIMGGLFNDVPQERSAAAA